MNSEAVTLFIQGHGSENLNKTFNNDHTVELLSFVGMPGLKGEMGICEYNDKQIDINIIEFIHNQYAKQYYSDGTLDNEIQFMLMNEIFPEFLPEIYKKCDIIYENGFTKTWPRWERKFTFKPNLHENCRICQLANLNNSEQKYNLSPICINGRCLPERNKNNLCCPEYGLTVVCSSFPEDIKYTLAGTKERVKSNINMSLSNKEYWKSRTTNYKYLIDQIYNEKYINLTDLDVLFKSMGFKYVYIFDPTCRSCEIDSIQAQQNAILEQTKPIFNNEIITNQPLSFDSYRSYNQNKPSYMSTFQDCYNGVCNMFQKKKIEGGFKSKSKTKSKKVKTKSKTKRKRKKSNKSQKKYYKIK